MRVDLGMATPFQIDAIMKMESHGASRRAGLQAFYTALDYFTIEIPARAIIGLT